MKLKFCLTIILFIYIIFFIACNKDSNKNEEQTQIVNISSAALNVKIDPGIRNYADVILKHFAAIENGDLTAFRTTLKPAEDGSDMYAQLSLIYKFFGDFFNISESAFNDAVANGGPDMDRIMTIAFYGVYPQRNRNNGLIVTEIREIQNFIEITVIDNKNEEIKYRLTYYSGETPDGSVIYAVDRHLPMPKKTILVFPESKNLFQYDSVYTDTYRYGLPNTRIWGWSKNGKIAYSMERHIDGRGGQVIYFIILDLITDKNIFELKMDSYDHDDAENEDLYILHENAIKNALNEFDIINEGTNFLPFPLVRDTIEFNANLTDVTYKDDDWGFFEKVVTGYKISVTANTRSKIIRTLVPLSNLTNGVYVCGYVLSPFENRMMVVTAEEAYVFEGTEMFYIFSGCHLGVGFN